MPLPKQVTNSACRSVDCYSRTFPTQNLTDPVATASQICPSSSSPLHLLVWPWKAYHGVWIYFVVLARRGASRLSRRLRRRVAMSTRGKSSVCDRWSAVAPGHGCVGGDMMRRRRSCIASGFRILSVICPGRKSGDDVRTLAWFLNMFGNIKTQVASVSVPSVRARV